MIVAIVVVVSVPFLLLLLGRPVVRRLATRSIARRRVELLLVVAGSMLATAILTGSLLVGNTVDRSIRSQAYDQLGPVDELVVAGGYDAGRQLQTKLAGFTSPDVDGVLPLVTTDAAAVILGDRPRVQPVAQLVEVDFATAVGFGGDRTTTGITGDTPRAGAAVITDDLASKLGVGAGDQLTVYAYGQALSVKIDRILPSTGVAGFWINRGQHSYNVFVAPGTVTELYSQASTSSTDGAAPPNVMVAVSNIGGVESGARRTDQVSDQLRAALGDTAANVRPVKQTVLDFATSLGSSLGDLYFTVGMFAVAAGILLLVNIFVMLADERRHELGMMRAIGLRRAPMVGQFAAEGWIYAAVSAAVGTIVGIGLGWVIAWRTGQILSSGREVDSLQIHFAFSWGSVLAGFAIGFLISLLTILVTSIRIARLNVIGAIRDLPDNRVRRTGRRWQLVGAFAAAVGTVWAVLSVIRPSGYGVLVGPSLAIVGLGLSAARRWPPTRVATVCGTAVLVWAVLAVPVLGMLDVGIDIPIFLVQGLLLVASAVAVVTMHQASIGRAISRLSGGSLSVRIGLAYPLARTFRTAMSIGMIAIVVLTLTYISTLSKMFEGQADQFTKDLSGGYEIVLQSNPSNPVPMDELAATGGVDAVAPLDYVGADFVAGSDKPVTWPVSGFGAELLRAPPELKKLGSHPDARAAWQAALDDPNLIIVDESFLVSEAGPPSDTIDIGDTVTMIDPLSGKRREVTVTALATTDMLGNGAFYGHRGLVDLMGDRAVPSRALVSAARPAAVVDRLRSSFVVNGVEADTIYDRVTAVLALNTAFFTLMEQFVGAGLLVGMAGIGVTMVRAVRERRREIGVLRSLGFPNRSVARAFVIEAIFVAVEGVVIGMSTAIIASYGLAHAGADWSEGLRWSLPTSALVIIGGATCAAALVASLWPALTASRIRPAVALRIAD